MSCNLETLLAVCPNLQERLDDHFVTCHLRGDISPLAMFLTSGTNMSGLNQRISPGNGKLRRVELTYRQKIAESEVTSQDAEFCLATTERGECLEIYDLDENDNLKIEGKFTEESFRRSCMSAADWIVEITQSMLIALEEAISTKYAEKIALMKGGWGTSIGGLTVDGAGNLVVKTQKDASIDPFPNTFQDIRQALMLSCWCDGAFIAGGTELWRYFDLIQSGCCAAYGLDLGDIFRRFGMAVDYDRRVADALGGPGTNDTSIVVQRGSVQPIWWVRGGWTAGLPAPFTQGADFVNTVAVTPNLGIPADVFYRFICPGEIHVVASVATDIVSLPLDIFRIGDKCRGVNYIAGIQVTNV